MTPHVTHKRLITFLDWYRSLPALYRPQFKDHGGRRIVFADPAALPEFVDYVVTRAEPCLVHLTER